MSDNQKAWFEGLVTEYVSVFLSRCGSLMEPASTHAADAAWRAACKKAAGDIDSVSQAAGEADRRIAGARRILRG